MFFDREDPYKSECREQNGANLEGYVLPAKTSQVAFGSADADQAFPAAKLPERCTGFYRHEDMPQVLSQPTAEDFPVLVQRPEQAHPTTVVGIFGGM